ncbi:hypothetical protein ACFCW4_12035 [Streptomyces virginiae]|uniref:hypothetical protein n=1 Tax=Streptomyces virginiae TaxID=1961 RepID=UPI0035D7D50E
MTSRATNGPQTAVDRERGAVGGEPAGAGQYAPGQVAQGHAGKGRAEYGDQRLVAPEQPVGDRPGEEGERAEDHGEDPRGQQSRLPEHRCGALAAYGAGGDDPGELLLDREEQADPDGHHQEVLHGGTSGRRAL